MPFKSKNVEYNNVEKYIQQLNSVKKYFYVKPIQLHS